MIYLFSFIAGRHPNTMRSFLMIRWLTHLIAAHPIGFIGVTVAAFFVNPIIFVASILIDTSASLFWDSYRFRCRIWKFKRQWPVLWAQTQKQQILDYDDGHLNRPFMAAPKLSIFYKRRGFTVTWKIRPAVGATLEELATKTEAIASHSKHVCDLEVIFDKTSDYRGLLTAVLGEPYKITQRKRLYV